MKLLFVGDGPRDEAMVPAIVNRTFPQVTKDEFRAWKNIRLDRGRGYEDRLKFALRIAIDAGMVGVVATLDRDKAKSGDRLSALRSARENHRTDSSKPRLRIALGEANPHAEAWILDDPKAIRDVLGLPTSTEVPNVRDCGSPKDSLHALFDQSDRDDDELVLLAELASALNDNRCNHRTETGFQDFIDDIATELV
jgi:hypothetical protein